MGVCVHTCVVCVHVRFCVVLSVCVHACTRMCAGEGGIVVTPSQQPLPQYPDPNPWCLQPDRVFSILDFVDLKFPPSLFGTIPGLPVLSFGPVGALFL